VVTAWGEDPAAPEPTAPGTSVVQLTDEQFQALAFGLGLVVMLGGASLVGSWRR
jgi:hypothetical protein